MKIFKSPTYFQNLKGIYKNTAEKWGMDQARKYTSGIQEAVNLAAKEQGRWKKYLYLPALSGRPLFYISHQKHFIFFEIDESKDLMLVIAIFHNAMDIPNRLKEVIPIVNEALIYTQYRNLFL